MFDYETQSDTPDSNEDVIALLEAELGSAREQARKSKRLALLLLALVGAYLAWAGSQVSKLLDPVGLAEATTGVAIEAVPAAGANLRIMVVDGAPDLARSGTQAVLDLIPAYRDVLENELTPVIDEVTGVLAQSVVHSLVKSSGKQSGDAATRTALEAGTDAVMLRLDTVLETALDQPTEAGGPTPRETIEMSLSKLKRVDSGLKKIAAGKGDPKERELILSWISMLQQFDAEAEAAAIQAYKRGERVDD